MIIIRNVSENSGLTGKQVMLSRSDECLRSRKENNNIVFVLENEYQRVVSVSHGDGEKVNKKDLVGLVREYIKEAQDNEHNEHIEIIDIDHLKESMSCRKILADDMLWLRRTARLVATSPFTYSIVPKDDDWMRITTDSDSGIAERTSMGDD